MLAANLDGVARKARVIIEGKTTGVVEDWGEQEGSDEIPDRVNAQGLHQIECCQDQGIEIDWVWVPVLLAVRGRPELRMYRHPANEGAQKAILEAGTDFWYRHVVPRQPPVSLLPSLETVKRIRRTPKAVAQVPPELVTAHEAAAKLAKEANDAADQAKAALLLAMGEAEAADFGDPTEAYTYFEQSRAGVNVKKLRTQRPDVFSQFDSTSYYRVLRRGKKRF